jgi:hypothetical protein
VWPSMVRLRILGSMLTMSKVTHGWHLICIIIIFNQPIIIQLPLPYSQVCQLGPHRVRDTHGQPGPRQTLQAAAGFRS